MGRGRGGYISKQNLYYDSGNIKVKDAGSIFVAERYIDMGYESVFRRQHQPEKSYDLTIKSSDDQNFIKNIEVKSVEKENLNTFSKRIKDGFTQFCAGKEDTVAIYLPNMKSNEKGLKFVKEGFDIAKRKGFVKNHVEVWYGEERRSFYFPVFCSLCSTSF